MRIAFVGNCQLESLSWYFQYLLPNAQIHWVSFSIGEFPPEIDLTDQSDFNTTDIVGRAGKQYKRYGGFNFRQKFKNLKNRKAFTKKFLDKPKLTQDPDDYISSCDLVVYQILSKTASPKYYKQRLESLISKDATRFKLPAFHIDLKNIDKTLQGIRDRCDVNNTDIHINEILEHVAVKSMTTQTPSHPKAIYFLEVVRLLCFKLGIDFFSEEDYEMFVKTGFPFG